MKEITRSTLSHYDREGARFRDATRNHDVSQNYVALLDAIEAMPPFTLLDFGCGPGRDLAHFRRLGHEAIGLDGSKALVELARADSGCEVLHQDFIELDLPAAHFDGVFANASLFHVPRSALPEVLLKLNRCLKPRGVLFTSNPRGDDQEGYSGERYGCYYTLESWRRLVTGAGFEELHHYYRPPGLPIEQQPWLASVWRKT
ncbi:MAG: class I SAM-dependent methyltransferase [Azoarcus sp.]|nr:class I SAM-dependent methyltransferase [Azoarcus sp.]